VAPSRPASGAFRLPSFAWGRNLNVRREKYARHCGWLASEQGSEQARLSHAFTVSAGASSDLHGLGNQPEDGSERARYGNAAMTIWPAVHLARVGVGAAAAARVARSGLRDNCGKINSAHWQPPAGSVGGLSWPIRRQILVPLIRLRASSGDQRRGGERRISLPASSRQSARVQTFAGKLDRFDISSILVPCGRLPCWLQVLAPKLKPQPIPMEPRPDQWESRVARGEQRIIESVANETIDCPSNGLARAHPVCLGLGPISVLLVPLAGLLLAQICL